MKTNEAELERRMHPRAGERCRDAPAIAPKKAAPTSSLLNKTFVNNQKEKKEKERIKDGLSGDNMTGLHRRGSL